MLLSADIAVDAPHRPGDPYNMFSYSGPKGVDVLGMFTERDVIGATTFGTLDGVQVVLRRREPAPLSLFPAPAPRARTRSWRLSHNSFPMCSPVPYLDAHQLRCCIVELENLKLKSHHSVVDMICANPNSLQHADRY